MAEARTVLTAVHGVAEHTIAGHAARVDRERAFPESSLAVLARTGALGLVVPAKYGGAGGSLTALAEACEAIGGACASSGMVFLMHSVAAATIAAGGGPRANETLRLMSAGKVLGTIAFSERGTGAHFYAPALRVVRENGALRISGRKSFVTAAGRANVLLLLAQGDGEGAADVYLVERDREGLTVGGSWDGLGIAGGSSFAVELADVRLSDQDRIGEPGSGMPLVFDVVVPFFLVGLAAVNTGIASAARTAAIEHASARRYVDGSRLAEVQYVQHLIAEMDAAVRAARLLVHEAARLGDVGDDGAQVAIMEAKIAATEAAGFVTQRALEATGGQGYTAALPVERHLRDGHAGAVMAPTNAVLKSWIGRALVGLPVP